MASIGFGSSVFLALVLTHSSCAEETVPCLHGVSSRPLSPDTSRLHPPTESLLHSKPNTKALMHLEAKHVHNHMLALPPMELYVVYISHCAWTLQLVAMSS